LAIFSNGVSNLPWQNYIYKIPLTVKSMQTYVDNKAIEELLKDAQDFSPPTPGTLVEGRVISMFKNKLLVDLGGIYTGVITGQEARDSFNTLDEVQVGDNVTSYVLEEENEDGLVVLSLRKASQQKTWQKFVDAHENEKSIIVKASEANKGGLLLNIDGIKGFIPVSQLAPLHYPRVNGADANEILNRLKKLVGIDLRVRILNLDLEGGKLILSEKEAEKEMREEAINELAIGQELEGKISGIVKFGIFVTFDGLEGLVHISEIAWGHVKNPSDYGKLGDKVNVLVIGKEGQKISLSMKRLTPDPWVEAAKNFTVGTEVEGKVSKVTQFGAFIKLADEINGLIHVSEMDLPEGENPSTVLKIGDPIKAKVITIDPDDHRVGLTMKDGTSQASKADAAEKKAKKAAAAAEADSDAEAVEEEASE
jgi:small subunit ribosomal protein S1